MDNGRITSLRLSILEDKNNINTTFQVKGSITVEQAKKFVNSVISNYHKQNNSCDDSKSNNSRLS